MTLYKLLPALPLNRSVAVTKRAPEADDGRAAEISLAVISAQAEVPYFGENCILSAQINSPAGATVSFPPTPLNVLGSNTGRNPDSTHHG